MNSQSSLEQISASTKQRQHNHALYQSFSEPSDSQVDVYKSKLLTVVVGISTIIVLIIIERIFYEQLLDYEADIINPFQSAFGVLKLKKIIADDAEEVEFYEFKSNWGWELLGALDMFKYNFLLMTLYIGIFFVAVDSLLAIKVGFMGISAYFFMTCINLIYGGPRPFWYSDQIGSPSCLDTYSHPSRSSFLILFMIFYSIFCFKRRVMNREVTQQTRLNKKYRWIEIILCFIIFIFFFLKYLMGIDFLLNLFLAVLYFLIFFFTLTFGDSYIDSLVQKSSIQERSSKKYVFYWLLYSGLALLFASSIYNNRNPFPPADYVKNYTYCAQTNSTLDSDLPYQEILGPWPTFLQSTCIFGLIGASFGAAFSYRHTIKNYNWFLGPTKKRVFRALILIVCMVPSLLLTIYEKNIVSANWVKEMGYSEFFFNAVHYLILYAFIFAGLPLIYLKLKLIEDSDTYTISIIHNHKYLSFIQSHASVNDDNNDNNDNGSLNPVSLNK